MAETASNATLPLTAATPAHTGDSDDPGRATHVLPVRTYLAVYAALMVLTYVTVQVSVLDLGSAAIYVAMVVATIKAGLVVGYFMHLKYDVRFNSLVFLSSLLFLAIFFVLTMVDVASRDSVLEDEGNFRLLDDQKAAPPGAAPGVAPGTSAPGRSPPAVPAAPQ
jgi:cytochrome c oxidase subunit 4